MCFLGGHPAAWPPRPPGQCMPTRVGGLHLTPLGRSRNSPRGRRELPASDQARKDPTRGVHRSPFTVHPFPFAHTAAPAGRELPVTGTAGEYLSPFSFGGLPKNTGNTGNKPEKHAQPIVIIGFFCSRSYREQTQIDREHREQMNAWKCEEVLCHPLGDSPRLETRRSATSLTRCQ